MTNRAVNVSVIIATVFTLAVFLGFALGASFSTGCPDVKDAPFGCVEWWLGRYQTLIAMVGAIFLGWFAALPVWKQLKLSAVQTAVILHQVLSAREKLLEDRASSDLSRTEKLSQDLNEGYFQHQGQPSLGHWVWDMEQVIHRAHEGLVERQTENLDGDETMAARKKLITALDRLSDCMADFNSLIHAEGSDIDITPEMKEKIKADEDRAAIELPKRIDEASVEIGNLRKAFDADLERIRRRRQAVDQELTKTQLTWRDPL